LCVLISLKETFGASVYYVIYIHTDHVKQYILLQYNITYVTQ